MLHLQPHREPSRYDDAQIRQEGSLFTATHVSGGSLFQGNFVGFTISKRVLPVASFSFHAHRAQTPPPPPGPTTQASSPTPRSPPSRHSSPATPCTTRSTRSSTLIRQSRAPARSWCGDSAGPGRRSWCSTTCSGAATSTRPRSG